MKKTKKRLTSSPFAASAIFTSLFHFSQASDAVVHQLQSLVHISLFNGTSELESRQGLRDPNDS